MGTTFLTNQITNDGMRIATTPFRNSVCAKHEMRQGLPEVFYVRPTTCADCFYFCAEQREFEGIDGDEILVCPAGCEYGNEARSSESESFRPIRASDDACEEHATEIEIDIQNERKQEDTEREAKESAAARQSEVSAERLTMQILGKLRKGAQP
jgi:hypothetical protein